MKKINLLDDKFVWNGKVLNEQIKDLNCDTEPTVSKSGGCLVRFVTNSRKMKIQFEIVKRQNGNFPHIGITAQEGIAILYKKRDTKKWYHVDCMDARNGGGSVEIDMNKYLYSEQDTEIMICMPILAYISLLEVYVEKESFVYSVKKNESKSILFIGGIHTYGVGVTSSAMMFTNILARKYDFEIYNVAFNTYNVTKKIAQHIEKCIKEIDNLKAIFIEADYIKQEEDIFLQYFCQLLNKLKDLNCPIYMWNLDRERIKKYKNTIKCEKISRDIYILETKKYLICDEDMCMYSKNFINDTGNVVLYRLFAKILDKI